jgi:hypothetical protein
MNTRISPILWLALTMILFTCSEEEERNPQIETLSVTALSISEIEIKGTIKDAGTIPPEDYGVVYAFYENGFDIFNGNKVSLGKSPSSSSIDAKVELQYGGYQYSKIYARTYFTNERGTVYGEIKSVDLPILSVSSVSPLAAAEGQTITIYGNNFSPEASEDIVTFNYQQAQVTQASASSLKVIVPSNITTYYWESISIRVSVGPQQVQATYNFQILPSVTGMTPTHGTFGTQVILQGKNFAGQYMTLYVNDIQSTTSMYSTSDYAYFYIPNDVTSKTLKFKLGVNNEKFGVPGEFTMDDMEVSSFSPSEGVASTSITVSGSNFNPQYNYYGNPNKVKIGGVDAYISSYSSTYLQVTVPTGLSAGDYSVSINNGVETVTTTDKFTIVTSSFDGFSPSSGYTSTYVTLQGAHLGTQGSVKFGDYEAGVNNWTENSIGVYVPYWLSSGNYKITITTASGQVLTSATDFVVQ